MDFFSAMYVRTEFFLFFFLFGQESQVELLLEFQLLQLLGLLSWLSVFIF